MTLCRGHCKFRDVSLLAMSPETFCFVPKQILNVLEYYFQFFV